MSSEPLHPFGERNLIPSRFLGPSPSDPEGDAVSQTWEEYLQRHAQSTRDDYMAWVEAEVEEFRLFNHVPRSAEERADWIAERLYSYLAPERESLDLRLAQRKQWLEAHCDPAEAEARFAEDRLRLDKEFDDLAARRLAAWQADLVPLWEMIPPRTL